MTTAGDTYIYYPKDDDIVSGTIKVKITQPSTVLCKGYDGKSVSCECWPGGGIGSTDHLQVWFGNVWLGGDLKVDLGKYYGAGTTEISFDTTKYSDDQYVILTNITLANGCNYISAYNKFYIRNNQELQINALIEGTTNELSGNWGVTVGGTAISTPYAKTLPINKSYSISVPALVTTTSGTKLYFTSWGDGTTTTSRTVNLVASFDPMEYIAYYGVCSVTDWTNYKCIKPGYKERSRTWTPAKCNPQETTVGTGVETETNIYDKSCQAILTVKARSDSISVAALATVDGASDYTEANFGIDVDTSYTLTVETKTTVGTIRYDWAYWEDTLSTNPSRTVNIKSNTTLLARYTAVPTIAKLTINAICEGISMNMPITIGGSDKTTPYSFDATIGTKYSITMGFTTEYGFVKWSDTLSTDPSRSISIDTATIITGEYKKVVTKNLTIQATCDGTSKAVSGKIDGTSFSTPQTLLGLESGASYTIILDSTTITGTNCKFTKWSDGNTNSQRSISITADTTITAIYETITTTAKLTINALRDSEMIATECSLDGQTFPTPATRDITKGTTYTLTVEERISGTDYKFNKWNDGVTNYSRDVNITADTTYTAYYIIAHERVKLNIYAVCAGEYKVATVSTDSVSAPTPATFEVDLQGDYIISISSAIAGTECIFDYWSDDPQHILSNIRTINIFKETTLIAYYKKEPTIITLTINAEGDGKMISVSGDVGGTSFTTYTASGSLPIKKDIPYTINIVGEATIEGAKYTFDHWSDGQTSTSRSFSSSITTTLTAYYTMEDITAKLTITATCDGLSATTTGDVGGISFTETPYTVGINKNTNYTITLADTISGTECKFSSWDNGYISATRLISITEDTTIIAKYTKTTAGCVNGTTKDTLYCSDGTTIKSQKICENGVWNGYTYTCHYQPPELPLNWILGIIGIAIAASAVGGVLLYLRKPKSETLEVFKKPVKVKK